MYETETRDCIRSSKPNVVPTKETESDQIDAHCEIQDVFYEFNKILNEETRGITHESDNRDDVDDSDDSEFIVELDNLLYEPQIDMNEVRCQAVNETKTREIDDTEVVNTEVFLYESSSDKGGSNKRRKSLWLSEGQWKTVKQEIERCNNKRCCRDKEGTRFHKNDKNRVRAICKGTIPDLGQLDPCGLSQSNNESEENKFPWVLYACKWEQDVDWEIRTYEKEHRCLQTRNVKASLQEQLQREYQVDISKMTIFRDKTLALNQEEAFMQGVLAGKRYYLGLVGTFMKGPYPGMILTTVGPDGNNYTYPLAYVVVEAKNINSWTWFLRCLGNDIDLQDNSNFTYISDRQKLRKLNNDCYEWVKYIPPQHWSRAHFTGRAHCDGLLNNLYETINNQIKKARDQKIVICLEFIRKYLMLRSGSFQKVSVPWMDQCVVDMVHHTCSCRRWELTSIPCKHALVAIWDMRKNNQNVGLLNNLSPEKHDKYVIKAFPNKYIGMSSSIQKHKHK
uniref:SWIM-type domain-containing protein n=1 Tax=Lactuca sativa TaxID=4236 RepID=A0A9R1WY13_LACSA|nr:hypothetical protein LSAT_V11C800445540 [Lactuca sativa]